VASPAEEVVLGLEGLYSRCYASAVHWAEQCCGDRALAEDAVQEAFVQILNSVARGNVALLNGGAVVVRRNTRWAAQKLRERASASDVREQHYAAVGLDEDEAWVSQEACDLLGAICASLSERHRQVLHLRYLEGHSDSACARRLGITVDAFRSRHRSALVEARRSSQTLGLGASAQ